LTRLLQQKIWPSIRLGLAKAAISIPFPALTLEIENLFIGSQALLARIVQFPI
jgi:hypothetical protein